VRQSDRRWITLLRARHVPVQNFKHFKTLEIGWQKKRRKFYNCKENGSRGVSHSKVWVFGTADLANAKAEQ